MKRSDLKAADVAGMLAERGRDLVAFLLPNAVEDPKNPDAYRVGSVAGEPGSSMVINLAGRHAGTYIDWSANSKSQDFLRLIMEVRGLSIREAFVFACEWLGIPEDDGTPAKTPLAAKHSPIIRAPRIETKAPSETWIRLQRKLRVGTQSELQQLADLRQIPFTAPLELATLAGQLWFGEVWDDGYEWPCWILTDAARRNAQARRIDGQPFAGIGGKKAKTIVGCEASWPVGITEAVRKPEIALVEGGPDFLAAWYFIWVTDRSREVGPVAMFGASQPIHPEALPHFRDKTVWVFPHEDQNRAGLLGAIGWRDQLRKVPAKAVHFFDFSPNSVKDLNELATQHGQMEAAS